MPKDYSGYGNYTPPTQQVDTRSFMPNNWVDFINPFWMKIEADIPEDHYGYYTTERTVQPIYDFVSYGRWSHPITFVVKFSGFDIPITRISYAGDPIEIQNQWLVQLSIQTQHNNPDTMKAMKQASNSIGLAEVHQDLLATDFFEVLHESLPNFKSYKKPGGTESYGKSYRLGEMKFKGKTFEDIKQDLLKLFTIVSGLQDEFTSNNINTSKNDDDDDYFDGVLV